jgi:hypothetical protein
LAQNDGRSERIDKENADELYAMNFTPYSDPSLYPGTRGENEQDTFSKFYGIVTGKKTTQPQARISNYYQTFSNQTPISCFYMPMP